MKQLFVLVLVLFTFISCTKKKKTTPFITWTYLGQTHSTNLVNVEVKSHHMSAIEALNSINIYTTSFEVGDYAADAAHAINSVIVGFTINDTLHTDPSNGGFIHIETKKDDHINGTFAVSTSTGATVSGSFENIPSK